MRAVIYSHISLFWSRQAKKNNKKKLFNHFCDDKAIKKMLSHVYNDFKVVAILHEPKMHVTNPLFH